MRWMLKAGVVTAALLAMTGGVTAQPVPSGEEGELTKFLPPVPGTRICFSRLYDAEHLKAHPKQKVTELEFRLSYYRHPPAEDLPKGQNNYYFALFAKLRGSSEKLQSFGECTPSGDAIACMVECDGGGIQVKRRPDEKVLVYFAADIGRIRMAGCDGDEEGDSVDLTPGADDREFLLSKTPDAECPAYDDW